MKFTDRIIQVNFDNIMNCAERDSKWIEPNLIEALERAYKEGRDQGHKDIQDKVNDFLRR